ncbi:MAG: ROK family protein, partial [Ruminococcaceae bacterium]|nr:ROK family protein [Oscillospiraceae bacterium]
MIKAILDPQFQPMVVVLDEYIEAVKKAENTAKLTIGVERNKGFVSTFELDIYADGTGHDEENYAIAERIIKTMLWTKGGWKVIIHGSKYIADRIAADYKEGGAREFDAQFMARVYEKPFEVEGLCSCCPPPKTFETSNAIGRHLDGCRIGFDAGGSDRKVSAVVN